MTPRSFRALPRLDQIEIMAHEQERSLRRAHADHVAQIVGKLKDPTEKAEGKRGR